MFVFLIPFFIHFKIYEQISYEFLHVQKRELIEVFSGIHDSLLRDLKIGLSHYFRIKPSSFDPIFFLMQMIHENELFKEKYANILSSLYNEHRSCVIVSAFIYTICLIIVRRFLKLIIKQKNIFLYKKETAIKKYQEKRDQIYAQSANEVHALISIAQWFQQELDKLRIKFPTPLMKFVKFSVIYQIIKFFSFFKKKFNIFPINIM